MKIKNCRICNSNKLIKLFSLGSLCFTGKFPTINQKIKKKPIQVVLCKKCGLVQLGHRFDLKYLYGPDYGYRTGINKTMLDHVKLIVKKLSKLTNLNNKDLVLDIASNDGSLLNFYKKDICTFGIDPILKKYRKNYKNINYKVEDFFSYEKIKKFTKKKFKIITALSVFYDAENPNKFIQDVKKILSDDGVFVLEFADLASILKYKMFDTVCHEHLEYYSTEVIKNLCKKHSLKVFNIIQNDINGASKQFYISHTNSRYKVNHKTINRILNNEKFLKLKDVKTYKKFMHSINKSKNQLMEKLKTFVDKGKKIHCYGASTKGNVLLQYYGINNKIVEFAAERNRLKYNLFTPGSKIKIISEKLSRSLKPDYYLVLPWHFKNEILTREKFIRKKGVKFIFPLPSLKII